MHRPGTAGPTRCRRWRCMCCGLLPSRVVWARLDGVSPSSRTSQRLACKSMPLLFSTDARHPGLRRPPSRLEKMPAKRAAAQPDSLAEMKREMTGGAHPQGWTSPANLAVSSRWPKARSHWPNSCPPSVILQGVRFSLSEMTSSSWFWLTRCVHWRNKSLPFAQRPSDPAHNTVANWHRHGTLLISQSANQLDGAQRPACKHPNAPHLSMRKA